jgi:hypothetical protein
MLPQLRECGASGPGCHAIGFGVRDCIAGFSFFDRIYIIVSKQASLGSALASFGQRHGMHRS